MSIASVWTTHRAASRWLLGAACALMLGGCGSPLEALNVLTPDGGYERRAGVAYGDAPRQRLDVYRANEPAADPRTVVFVYGGAWRKGKREHYEFVAGKLAAAGHDVILPDYRLYPDVTWPAFVEDVAAAIRQVERDAPSLLDRPLEDIVLMGHSSGAHTAAVLAAAADRWLEGSAVRVTGLIGIAGPYDLPVDDPEVAPVFAGPVDQRSALPIELIDGSHPATLLLHGSDDDRVLPMHTERYAEALERAGVPVSIRTLDGTGHAAAIASFATPLSLLNDASGHTIDWLADHDPGPDSAAAQELPD